VPVIFAAPLALAVRLAANALVRPELRGLKGLLEIAAATRRQVGFLQGLFDPSRKSNSAPI